MDDFSDDDAVEKAPYTRPAGRWQQDLADLLQLGHGVRDSEDNVLQQAPVDAEDSQAVQVLQLHSSGGSAPAEAEDGAGDGDEVVVEADFQLSPADVIARIEGFLSSTLEAVSQGQLPQLELVSRTDSNTHLVADGAGDMVEGTGGEDAGEEGSGDGGDEEQQVQRRLRLGSKVQTKTLVHGKGAQAYSVARGECHACGCPQQALESDSPPDLAVITAPVCMQPVYIT